MMNFPIYGKIKNIKKCSKPPTSFNDVFLNLKMVTIGSVDPTSEKVSRWCTCSVVA
jgi:hypothetical protein